MKGWCACVVTHEIPARQIRVTDGKAAPLLRCSRADVSATDFRRRTASRRCCTKEAKKSRKKIEKMREKWIKKREGERKVRIGNGRVNKTPCGTSTTGVSRYSRDGEIGLKLKIELSSLLPRSFKFTLQTFHIPDLPRYVSFAFAFACGRRNNVFTFFRRMLSTRKDRL